MIALPHVRIKVPCLVLHAISASTLSLLFFLDLSRSRSG